MTNPSVPHPGNSDRLENYGIYQLARALFEAFWSDSEVMLKDFRGRELVKQQAGILSSPATRHPSPQ